MKSPLSLCLALVVTIACSTPIYAAPTSPAPTIATRDASGVERRSASLRGKRALLVTFFPRCFTGTCHHQLTSLRDAYPQLQKAGVEVWAVSVDPAEGPQGQRAFAQKLKLPFPLLPDTDRKISLAFGAVQSREQMAARMSVLIGKDGRVMWVDKQINPRTHGADVLKRLQAEGLISSGPKEKSATPSTR